MAIWMISKQARFLILALTAFLAIGLSACSDDDDDSPATTGGNTGAATGATGATGAGASTGGGAATGAAGESVEVTIAESDLGPFLAGPDGRSLYVFIRDEPDTTNCSGGCLQNWPPLLLEDGETVEAGPGIDGDFASIDTPSGEQVTYNGAPLYYFAADTAAGETKGHLVGDVWFLARPDTASTAVVGVQGSGGDGFLVGPTGMTLYLFANDTAGTSNCSGGCLQNWPALTVPEGIEPTAVSGAGGELGVFVRDDGARQVTYDGMPVYYFINDKLPGDTTGDGVGGVWTLAKP